MPTYAIAQIIVKDKEKLGQYREKAGQALAKHGGSVVTAGPVAEVIETKQPTPDVLALLSFPSIEAALAWKNDEELAPIHNLRNEAGDSTVFVLS